MGKPWETYEKLMETLDMMEMNQRKSLKIPDKVRFNGIINELMGDFHGFSIAMSDCRRVWTLMGKTNWETMGKLWEIWNIEKNYGKWRQTGCRSLPYYMHSHEYNVLIYIYIYTYVSVIMGIYI